MSRSHPDGEQFGRREKQTQRLGNGGLFGRQQQVSGAGSRRVQEGMCSLRGKERPGFYLLDKKEPAAYFQQGKAMLTCVVHLIRDPGNLFDHRKMRKRRKS